MKTPEISVFQAKKETEVFAERMRRMFSMVEELTNTTDPEAFEELRERIAKYEQISDNMENEIGKYLGQISNAHLSDETKEQIRAMIRQISELESIGDSCYNLSRTLERRRSQEVVFTDAQKAGLAEIYKRLGRCLDQMVLVLKDEGKADDSQFLERELNSCRDRLRFANVRAIDEHEYDYNSGTIYMDLVAECEKCGDYVINVVEAK